MASLYPTFAPLHSKPRDPRVEFPAADALQDNIDESMFFSSYDVTGIVYRCR
jgi:hypothetical protein